LNPPVQPLAGTLVVDLSRYLPGAFATAELQRLGARVVSVEPPEGDPLRTVASAWHAALSRGKESVACDLKSAGGLELAQALLDRADVVVDGFRPGVLERLGLRVPEASVLCAITGFARDGPDAQRVGHDLNYLAYAGVLAESAPALPPLPVADLGGALAAVAEIVAALVERERTGRGARLNVSLTELAHRLIAYRLGGDPLPRFLSGGLACYRIYAAADGRELAVAALEPRFFARLCELVGRPALAPSQYEEAAQPQIAAELASALAERPAAEWIERFEGEEVCVAPVLTLREAAERLGTEADAGPPAELGEHTRAWREELGLQV
jgi:alpha-methylacyl-CoA racemase